MLVYKNGAYLLHCAREIVMLIAKEYTRHLGTNSLPNAEGAAPDGSPLISHRS